MNLPLSLRSSSLDRIFACPGSLIAAPLVPPVADSAESTEGTLLHYLIASRLVTELGAMPPEGGLEVPKLPKGYTLPAFSAWIVDYGVRQVRELVPPDWSLMVEPDYAYEYRLPRPVWVPVSEITGLVPEGYVIRESPTGKHVCIDRFTLTGHEDWRALSPDGMRSISGDWKTGQVGTDPAEENWQCSGYLGLGKLAWPELDESVFKLFQPRIDEEATGIPRVSDVTLSGDKLTAMNATIAEHVCRSLENRFTTDSSPKSCRYCPVALQRPWLCPSLINTLDYMKGTLTPQALEALASTPNDALLGDFVVYGRTLNEPVKAATELLHERIAAQGYVDAGCGARITVKETGGDYKIPDPVAFLATARKHLPEDAQLAEVFSPSMDKLKKKIAAVLDIPQGGKQERTAEKIFDAEFRPLTEQGKKRTLVLT